MTGGQPSLVLRNALVPPGPWRPDRANLRLWVSIRDGRIEAVGVDDEPEPAADQVVDLDGAVLLPGFVDSHTHLGWSAEDRWTVTWDRVADPNEALRSLRTVAARVTPGDWVTGGDWLPTELTDRALPTLADLDVATDGRPLCLVSRDHSRALMNSRGLELARITKETPDPPGGRIERDDRGEPTGLLRDSAVWSRLARGVVPPRNPARIRAELLSLLADLAARGVTEVHDIATFPREDDRAEIHEERSFTDVRTVDALGEDLSLRYSYRPSTRRVHEFKAMPTPTSPLISFGGFKMSLDNGWYSQPGGPRVDSFRYPGKERAIDLATAADGLGGPTSIHTMGDVGVAEALDILAALPPRVGRGVAPHRLIHARRMHPRDIARCGRLGFAVEVQPWEIVAQGAALESRGDGEFAATISPYRDLVESGATLTIGSDRRLGLRADERDTDQLTSIQLAVTRSLPELTGDTVWQPDQRLSTTQAFAAATVGGAIAAGAGHTRGRIAPGFDADLVALSADPWRLPAEDIARARPILTVSAGRIVYDKVSTPC